MAQFYYKSGSSWVNALNLFYPTGAIYASTTSTSPGTLFGGTWQQITNAALRAATSNIASYSGSDTHTLTVDEMPAHAHIVTSLGYNTNGGTNTHGSYWGGQNTDNHPVTNYVGGGQHIQSCNAPTIAICGGEQPRIEVAA